jgi:curved DNA-binding protein CbpA
VLTYYDVLGVEPTAELETIRRAWRLKVRLLHPDHHRDSPSDVRAEAARETALVNTAWETLRDPDKRHEYDARLPRRGEAEFEREATEPASDARSSPAAGQVRSASPYLYLNVASLLIVVVALACLLAGAVLLSRLT